MASAKAAQAASRAFARGDADLSGGGSLSRGGSLTRGSSNARGSSNSRLSSEGVKPLLSSFNDLVNNDKIFLLHFGLSSVFGIALLFSPNLFSFGNAIGAFACQVLSVFVLACGTFAFFAPTLEETSRALLGNTFKWTFALAATLCATEIAKSLGKGYYSFGAFFWDSAAFAVFALVSIGYFVNSKPGQPL